MCRSTEQKQKQRRTRLIDKNRGLEPNKFLVCKYVDENSSAAMLAAVGVTLEVNLRIPFHAGNVACKRLDPPWTSSEVQKRGISDPTKRTHVLKINFKKDENRIISVVHTKGI